MTSDAVQHRALVSAAQQCGADHFNPQQVTRSLLSPTPPYTFSVTFTGTEYCPFGEVLSGTLGALDEAYPIGCPAARGSMCALRKLRPLAATLR